MITRPRRFRLFPKSTAADVSRLRFVRHTTARPALRAPAPFPYPFPRPKGVFNRLGHLFSASAMCLAVSGRRFGLWLEQLPALLFGRRFSHSPLRPPYSSIGWWQNKVPPPHFLSATALMRGKHIFPAPPICWPSGYPIVHLTSIVACGGLRPPRPRSCGLCVPLRSWLRPRRYRLRNVSPAL